MREFFRYYRRCSPELKAFVRLTLFKAALYDVMSRPAFAADAFNRWHETLDANISARQAEIRRRFKEEGIHDA